MRARVKSNQTVLSKYLPKNLRLSDQDCSVLENILFSTSSTTRQLLSDLSSQPVNSWDARASNLIQQLQKLLASGMASAAVYELSVALKSFVNSRDYAVSSRYVRYGWSELGVVASSPEFKKFNATLDTFIESINPNTNKSYFNSLSALLRTSQSTFASVVSKLNPVLALVFFTGMQTAGAEKISTEGLVVDLPFEGNPFDVSGNEHSVVVSGAYLVEDMYGRKNSAYRFQNGAFMKGTPTLDFPTESRSISVWVNSRSGGTVFGYGGSATIAGASFNFQLDYECQTDRMPFLFGGSNAGPYFYLENTDITLPTGWTHFVMTTEPTVSKLYVNGVLVNSQPMFFNNTKLIERGDFAIGAFADPNGVVPGQWGCSKDNINADITRFKLYDRAVSANEALALYKEASDEPPKQPKPDKYNAVSLTVFFGAGFIGSFSLFGCWAYKKYQAEKAGLQQKYAQGYAPLAQA